MSYKMDRRKFLTYVGCGCCGFVINSCTTAPITDRKQLKLIPEAKLNAQAAQIYEKVKEKEKLIKDSKSLDQIKEIGEKMEKAMAERMPEIAPKLGLEHEMYTLTRIENE